MRFNHRRSHDSEEGESYYVSMTDMMVGVLFIFIIMLSYFALQYRANTAAITTAKDSATVALIQVAGPMQAKAAQIEVNPTKMIVCIPGDVLVAGEAPGDANRHCFSYSNTVAADEQAAAAQAALVSAMSTDLGSAPIANSANNGKGTLTFPASQLFVEGTSELTPEGQKTVAEVAAELMKNLPCYGYGTPAAGACPGTGKLAAIFVLAQVRFNAFTPDGRATEDLAVTRAVAFHDAVAKARPDLGNMRTIGSDKALLRVATSALSTESGSGNNGGTISIRFQMEKGQPPAMTAK